MAKGKKYSPEQVVGLLRQIEVAVANGKATPTACRENRITEQTYYRWRKEYGGLQVDQARRLKEFEQENAKLKLLVAESSFFMSVMYPTIFALGVNGLGENTKIAASLLVMAIIGGAVLTPIMGILSQTSGSIAVAYSVPLMAYVFVLLFAVWGSGLKPQASS